MTKVKITVVRRLNRLEIHKDGGEGCTCQGPPVCPLFEDGQVFIADMTSMPARFCAGAWADLYRFICGLQNGANYQWVNEPGKVLVACNDGFRPVIFRLERIETCE